MLDEWKIPCGRAAGRVGDLRGRAGAVGARRAPGSSDRRPRRRPAPADPRPTGPRPPTAARARGLDRPGRHLAGPGPVDGRRQAAARTGRRRSRVPEPGPLLVAHDHPDRRQPLGLPVRPAGRAAQPGGRQRHGPAGRREGLRLHVRPLARLVLHGQARLRRQGRADPAHLVPRPGHPDETPTWSTPSSSRASTTAGPSASSTSPSRTPASSTPRRSWPPAPPAGARRTAPR